ncbi:NAD(P)H-quinone oxidoreductase [Bradyrhizobium sp. SZCCHNR1015]|uniref:NAD(P)H-quinone oxidoreductase n=1 Tax=Bradyrhizobium sp. SZCCHNR1015 TaxID=3057338 RepID=UPI002916850E|nr:NAD(P)H-quinone oxidoreductase [Bradyrhizobium sp. SZCCHNR1015]
MIPDKQRAVIITAPGGPEVLSERQDWPVPRLGPDDVLIEVAAAGINRHDCNQRAAGPSREPNPIPGLEASGRIVACGADVSRERLGEAVIALTDGGSYAQYVATDQHLALDLPSSLDWIQGAALPEALFTTWFNFFELMRMAPGETALIHGGSSGVGTIAIQLLRALGHPVMATAGTAEKRALALGLGCSAVFDYADPDLAEQIRAATGTRGVDCILDTSAGAHIAQDLAALAMGGRIAQLSAGQGKELAVPLRSLMARRASITGAFLRSTSLDLKRRIATELRQRIWPLLGTAIRPHIDSTYRLSEAADAHARMDTGRHIGKIVLCVRE